MDWSAQLFHYCERGTDPSFWAEPFNAVSNAAFIVAASVAALQFRAHRLANGPSNGDSAVQSLIALVFAIGVGSFLFHAYATRWASVADTAPIGIFMLAYIVFALRRFLALPWLWIALALATFLLSMRIAGAVTCGPELLPITSAAGRSCMNGSLGYAPAFLALLILAMGLAVVRHPAAKLIAAATLVFAVSLTFRTLDFEVCAMTEFLGRVRGTHALWHITNAVLLYLLLRAAILHVQHPTGAPSR